MAEPTLSAVFGAGALQDADTITIQKSALVTKGLIASADNKAEQILAALIKLQIDSLTALAQGSNPDQSVTVQEGFNTLETRNGIQYYNTTVNVTFSKPQPSAGLTVNDY
jgi:hypothetical protein